MDVDFHYYCVGVLARAAGWSAPDALTIAYASQYVDNATESDPISVGDTQFEPVRTAHAGLGYVSGLRWAVQKRVYMAFHFLPPFPFSPRTHSYVTTPNNHFSRQLLAWAASDPLPRRRLCAIGIALHTYADTWAHKGFSGRWHAENNVSRLRVPEGKGWRRLPVGNVLLDAPPCIGHLEAGYFPDTPFKVWKYVNAHTGKECARDNPRDYLNAASRIHAWLRAAPKEGAPAPIPWQELRVPLRRLFQMPIADVKERCAAWQRAFAALFDPVPFVYDPLAWRADALDPALLREVAWDKRPRIQRKNMHFEKVKGFHESFWAQFHRAALRQRHWVLERLF